MSMMGELNYFLGLKIKKMRNGTFLSQTKYCIDMLRKFEMESCKEASTPISTSCYLDANENGTVVDQTKFRGLIGSLFYLTAADLTSCSSYVCVQDFKSIQRSLTTMQ